VDQVKPLYSAEDIAARVTDLAGEIAARTAPSDDRSFVMMVLLKGAFMFAADLARALDRHGIHPELAFLSASSYGAGTESSGIVETGPGDWADIERREVLLVDDILDTGRTLDHVRRLVYEHGAADVRTCVLLDKPARRVVDLHADFVGFEVPDRFVVGYGIDWAERFRHLPFLGVVES